MATNKATHIILSAHTNRKHNYYSIDAILFAGADPGFYNRGGAKYVCQRTHHMSAKHGISNSAGVHTAGVKRNLCRCEINDICEIYDPNPIPNPNL